MKLFIVTTSVYDYDDYDSFVVSAIDEKQAKEISQICTVSCQQFLMGRPEDLTVEEIGSYNGDKSQVLHASYNAG